MYPYTTFNNQMGNENELTIMAYILINKGIIESLSKSIKR
jgi:hypothetical protein